MLRWLKLKREEDRHREERGEDHHDTKYARDGLDERTNDQRRRGAEEGADLLLASTSLVCA
jgi:hypothetical protein